MATHEKKAPISWLTRGAAAELAAQAFAGSSTRASLMNWRSVPPGTDAIAAQRRSPASAVGAPASIDSAAVVDAGRIANGSCT